MEMKKGNALYKQEAYKDALILFNHGLELDPEATFAWRSVGLTNMALYRPGNQEPENLAYADGAIEAFKKYLEAYPDAPKALDYLVGMYINATRFEDAIAYLEKFWNDHPDQARVHSAMVIVLVKAGKVPEALRWANTHEQASEDAEVYYT